MVRANKNESDLKKKLETARKRLNAYYERELEMLSPAGVSSYGIGTKNIQRYNTELSEVRRAIKELEQKADELGGMLSGEKPRRVVGIIPMDW